MANNIIELRVTGMNCNNCAAGLSRYLQQLGLEEVYVNFSTEEVRFQQNNLVGLEKVKEGIHKMGYQVIDETTPEQWWTLERKLLISAIFTFPLLLQHLLMSVGVHLWMDNFWLQFALCIPVFIIGFLHFGKSAWSSLQTGILNMDVLIFIGSTAAFVYSLAGTFLQEANYIFYETSAMIITLVLLGNWLEKRAVEQTTTAISDLNQLQAEKARKIMPSGTVVVVDKQHVKVGDQLQVNEGDKIPADGMVITGTASVDESMLTGESLPVDKKAGDHVVGASLLASGNIRMEVTAIGKHTVLSQIIELVKRAQEDKPDIQRLADRISAVFVPAVLLIALATILLGYFVFGLSFQQALMNSIAVLVISCPCAMGLATPTAVMVGVGRLARNGILVKGGKTLEIFAGIKQMVFDKTGTLTTGKFKLQQIEYFDQSPAKVHTLIHKLEQSSSHPIAQSLVEEMKGKVNGLELELVEIKEEKGTGMLGRDKAGNVYKLGSSKILSENTHSKAQVHLTENDALIASINIADEIRPEAAASIAELKKQGIIPVILSGDQQEKTKQVAESLSIERFHAEKLPEEKLAIISQLSDQAPTAMIGDGINDAPALAKATLGVSLSTASQVAINSAQIVLLKGQLDTLPKAMNISKTTLQTIRQSLYWAFSYNIIAIPIAAMGFLNPMWGALFMAFSDVVVIGNAIRLKYRKIEGTI